MVASAFPDCLVVTSGEFVGTEVEKSKILLVIVMSKFFTSQTELVQISDSHGIHRVPTSFYLLIKEEII